MPLYIVFHACWLENFAGTYLPRQDRWFFEVTLTRTPTYRGRSLPYKVPRGRLQDITLPTSWSYIPFATLLRFLPTRCRGCLTALPRFPRTFTVYFVSSNSTWKERKGSFRSGRCQAVWSSGAFRYPDVGVTRQVRRYRWAIKVLQATPREVLSAGGMRRVYRNERYILSLSHSLSLSPLFLFCISPSRDLTRY